MLLAPNNNFNSNMLIPPNNNETSTTQAPKTATATTTTNHLNVIAFDDETASAAKETGEDNKSRLSSVGMKKCRGRRGNNNPTTNKDAPLVVVSGEHEAQENVRKTVVASPPESMLAETQSSVSIVASPTERSINFSPPLNTTSSPEEAQEYELEEQDEPEDDSAEGGGKRADDNNNNNNNDNNNEQEDEDPISRRVHLGAKGEKLLIGAKEELRKFKNQGSKFLLGSKRPTLLKRKRKKVKRKIKTTQTRQSGSTTVGYGNLSGFGGGNIVGPYSQQQQSLMNTNPISNTLRQLYPTLANPQQLSSTVQRLIMSKLSPQLLQHHLQQQQKQQQQQQQQFNPLAHRQVSTGALNEPYSLGNGQRNFNELLSQWSSSEEQPSYMANSGLASPSAGGGSQKQQNPKMIPIEIIGLDPSVTNSILYGGGESGISSSQSPASSPSIASGATQAIDTSQMFGSQDQMPQVTATSGVDDSESPGGSLYTTTQTIASPQPNGYASSLQAIAALAAARGGSVLNGQRLNNHHSLFSAASKPFERPKASSILHIHHFHTQASGQSPSQIVQQQQQQQSTAAGDEAQGGEGGGAASAVNGSPSQLTQLSQLMHLQQQRPGVSIQQQQKPQQQQMYVNDRGQLVYVSVEDQSNGGNGSQVERPASANAQVTEQDQTQQQQTEQSSADGSNNDSAGSWPTNNPDSSDQQVGQQQPQQDSYSVNANLSGGPQIDQQQQQQQQPQNESNQEHQLADPHQQQADQTALMQVTPVLNNAQNAQQQDFSVPNNLNAQNYLSLAQYTRNSHQNPGIFVVTRGQPGQQLVTLQHTATNSDNQGSPKNQPRAVYVSTNGQTYNLMGRPNEVNPVQQQQQQMGESTNTGAQEQVVPAIGGGDEKQQLLMVAYKPRHQQYRNTTEDPSGSGVALDRLRNPYNEGQESNPVTTKHLLPGGQQLLKNANLILRPLLHHTRINQEHQMSADDSTGIDQQVMLARYRPQKMNITDTTTNRFNNIAELAQQLSIGSNGYDRGLRATNSTLSLSGQQLQQQHQPHLLQIPIRMQMPLNQAAIFNHNASNLRASPDLNSLKGAWLTSLGQTSSEGIEKYPLLNGYSSNIVNNNATKSQVDLGSMLANGGGSNNINMLTSLQSHQQSLLENSVLLNQLRQLQSAREKLNHHQQAHNQLLLNTTNQTKITDDLLSILRDFKNNNITTSSSSSLSSSSPSSSSLPASVDHLNNLHNNNNNHHHHHLQQQQQHPPHNSQLQPTTTQLHSANYNTTGADSNLVSVLRSASGARSRLAQVNPANKFINGSPADNNANGKGTTPFNGLNNNNPAHHIQQQHQQQVGSSFGKESNSSQKVISGIGDWQQQQHHQQQQQQREHIIAHLAPQLPSPPLPPIQVNKKQHPTLASEMSEFDDSSGISNIALAFIFMVSLITLTIIAASMLYRHRRRTVGRCADLPARSARKLTRNLTQRTKHFVRANFVNPNDMTSIKSINTDSSSNSTSGSNGIGGLTKNPSGLKVTNVGSCGNNEGALNDDPLGVNNQSATNKIGYLTKKTFAQPSLSTFNQTPLSEKYQFTTQSCSEDSAADIKTLNTRLQKTSYLKSLISSPECLLLGGKSSKTNKPSANPADSTDSGAYYLNVRNKTVNSSHNMLMSDHNKQTRTKPTSPSGGGGGGGDSSSTSCQRLVGGGGSSSQLNNRAANNFSEKSYNTQSSIDNLSNSCGKQSKYLNNRKSIMCTIHSISDDGSKTSSAPQCAGSSSSPEQTKSSTSAQNSMMSRLGKLNNNLPAPKHLIAAFPINHSNLDDQRSNSRQTDSLSGARVEKL